MLLERYVWAFNIIPFDSSLSIVQVAVTRSPMFHPGDIRLLRAVKNDKLWEIFKDTSGGVILFSTNGKQTAAAFMSGGDFDGDKYYAIFNKAVVDAVKEVDPFDGHNLSVAISPSTCVEETGSSFTFSHSELSWNILIGNVNVLSFIEIL